MGDLDRPRLERHVAQGRTGEPAPGHRLLGPEPEEQLDVLLEELAGVVQGLAEDLVGLGEQVAPADAHLRAPAGDQVEDGEVLGDAERVAVGEQGHPGPQPQRRRPCGDRGEEDGRAHADERAGVVLADVEPVEPGRLGRDGRLDDGGVTFGDRGRRTRHGVRQVVAEGEQM
nr:hypothetical protein [Nocardioides humi]